MRRLGENQIVTLLQCRHLHMKIKEKMCVCGNRYIPFNSLQKYCSPLCFYSGLALKSKRQPLVTTKSKRSRQKSENSKWKIKVWKIFSKYIRLRDCLKTTKTTDTGICYTCNKLILYKDSQAGHCISGRGNYILLDEDCVELQCEHCNIELRGNYDIFIPKKIREKGLEWFEEKKRLSRISIKKDWHEEFNKYQEKYFKLLSSKKLPF